MLKLFKNGLRKRKFLSKLVQLLPQSLRRKRRKKGLKENNQNLRHLQFNSNLKLKRKTRKTSQS
jgi:hypothetical protein